MVLRSLSGLYGGVCIGEAVSEPGATMAVAMAAPCSSIVGANSRTCA